MSWKSVISSLQDTSESLLSDNFKTVNSRNKITKIKPRVISKNHKNDDNDKIDKIDNNDKIDSNDNKNNNDNKIPLDLLFKISKTITKSIEDVEILLKEKDVSFNSSSLTNDETIHDLIPIKEQLNNNSESTKSNPLSINNNFNITHTTNTSSTNTITKSRGRGRPYGSTSSRSNGKANSYNTANKFTKNSCSSKTTESKKGKSYSPTSSAVNSSIDSNNKTNDSNNRGKDNNNNYNSSDENKNDNSNENERNIDKDSKNINNSINSNIKNNTSISDKLITIGAKYGYPAPPPLSTYNGKIGRSFYTSAYNPSTPILPNSQVAYCANMGKDGNNNFSTMHSEWILCRVLRVISETRFEIQDPEPDDLHPQGQIFRANYKEIILVPLHLVTTNISKLKEYKAGTRVLAKYPETTTFYPAEVMASKNGNCMLRFEGEEEVGKLTSVDRVFVLPCPK